MSQPSTGAVRQRDNPWIFRTYAGHSNARDSNALYRKNLAKGQTGLSVAFDLPTQTGYDSDHPLAKSACRSPTSATCERCSRRSRSPTRTRR
jgi:(2R)-ethylmalonyl-CoA mutase